MHEQRGDEEKQDTPRRSQRRGVGSRGMHATQAEAGEAPGRAKPVLPKDMVDVQTMSGAGGNCMFWALMASPSWPLVAAQVGLCGAHTVEDVRKAFADYVRSNSDREINGEPLSAWVLVTSKYSVDYYATRMRQGMWAGDIELLVFSHLASTSVWVWQACGQGYKLIRHFNSHLAGNLPVWHVLYDGTHFDVIKPHQGTCSALAKWPENNSCSPPTPNRGGGEPSSGEPTYALDHFTAPRARARSGPQRDKFGGWTLLHSEKSNSGYRGVSYNAQSSIKAKQDKWGVYWRENGAHMPGAVPSARRSRLSLGSRHDEGRPNVQHAGGSGGGFRPEGRHPPRRSRVGALPRHRLGPCSPARPRNRPTGGGCAADAAADAAGNQRRQGGGEPGGRRAEAAACRGGGAGVAAAREEPGGRRAEAAACRGGAAGVAAARLGRPKGPLHCRVGGC